MTVAIRVSNLGKQYKLGANQESYKTFRDALVRVGGTPVRAVQAITRRGGAKTSAKPTFWALNDVNFEVEEGEAVGIIGRNGAGKSTLLKILSHVTAPTTGRVELHGRVGALLEVGTGFHPELSGRENIYLNGAILGMHRHEIEAKFDEIVAFAEVEKFIDTPVKHYSSGMYLRLAFAVAAHLEPEILVVDEVLAVGDANFQKKCLGKMDDVSRAGRTVLFVSHNMVALQSLCTKAIMLSNGQVAEYGDVNTVINHYLAKTASESYERVWDDMATAPGNDKVRVKRVAAIPELDNKYEQITVQTPIAIEVEFWNLVPNSDINLTLAISTVSGIHVMSTVSSVGNLQVGLHKGICYIPGNFLNDEIYTVSLLVVKDASMVLYSHNDIIDFEIHDVPRPLGWQGKWPGVMRPKLDFVLQAVEGQT